MSTNALDPVEDSALQQLQQVFARLDSSREQQALLARFLRITENLILNAAPTLSLTREMKAADDLSFMIKVLSATLAQYPLASKRDLLRLKGQMAFREQLEAAGGTYSSQQVAELLGIKPDAIRKRRTKGQLIAITVGEHHVYPTFQFDEKGVVERLPDILAILQAESPVDTVQFFLIPEDALDDTPISALKHGRNIDIVFRLARQFGRQVAR